MTKKMRSYSTEFKAEAVKKIADNNGNLWYTVLALFFYLVFYLGDVVYIGIW